MHVSMPMAAPLFITNLFIYLLQIFLLDPTFEPKKPSLGVFYDNACAEIDFLYDFFPEDPFVNSTTRCLRDCQDWGNYNAAECAQNEHCICLYNHA